MLYHEWIATTIYSEGESGYHKSVTKHVTEKFFDPLNLAKDTKILDIGCGIGYFLDEIKERGYTNYEGITLSQDDRKSCIDRGHVVKSYDLSFFPHSDGYIDESVGFIFSRHALEHSPYPLFTLIEYNRLLLQGARIYIEVPAPNCARKHEFNPNHFSILGDAMLVALLHRTGFEIEQFETIEFDITPMPAPDEDPVTVKERFYCVVARKARPLDLK